MSIDLHLDLYRIRKKHFRISAIQDTISKERKYAARKPTGKKKKKRISYLYSLAAAFI